AVCHEVAAYETVPETEDPNHARADLTENGADWITFASSSAVDNFHALKLKVKGHKIKCASIGPVTSARLISLGYKVHAEAHTHTIPGLIQAMISWETTSL
ncbi:MAG: uroporphyrinogen-III synthase, partial [Verrucomicrobiota bacterium]|nr:uroporphyrinogen-III synthase [Verrucomicrobiota bacterium]